MPLRALVIDDEEIYRRLLVQHVSTAFEGPSVAEYHTGRSLAAFGIDANAPPAL